MATIITIREHRRVFICEEPKRLEAPKPETALAHISVSTMPCGGFTHMKLTTPNYPHRQITVNFYPTERDGDHTHGEMTVIYEDPKIPKAYDCVFHKNAPTLQDIVDAATKYLSRK